MQGDLWDMMNYIIVVMVILSFFCSIKNGSINELSESILSAGTDAVTLTLKLAGIIALWSGISEIATASGITQKLCKLLTPVLKLLFPNIKSKETKEAISMNITANILGLGNAATPLGLEAMRLMQKDNKSPLIATNDMARFVVINTAALHIVPTSAALLRQEYGSNAPMEILLPALITSACALLVGIIMTKLLKGVIK